MADLPPIPLVSPKDPVGHLFAVGAFVVSFIHWLPLIVQALTGLLALAWYALGVWESPTVKEWRERHRNR